MKREGKPEIMTNREKLSEHRKILTELFDTAIRSLEMEDFIYIWLGQAFDVPCNYTFNGQDISDFMSEECGSWCEEHCGKTPFSECWKKFFEKYKEYVDSWHEERIGE